MACRLAERNESSGTASIYISSLKHVLIEQISVISAGLEFLPLESHCMDLTPYEVCSQSIRAIFTRRVKLTLTSCTRQVAVRTLCGILNDMM